MTDKKDTAELGTFHLIFEKLEEAKNEQNDDFLFCLELSTQANETIALFKEYQDSLIQSSYITFAKA